MYGPAEWNDAGAVHERCSFNILKLNTHAHGLLVSFNVKGSLFMILRKTFDLKQTSLFLSGVIKDIDRLERIHKGIKSW